MNQSSTLLVFCNASGNPTPNITWRKVGTTGPPAEPGNTMEIANVDHRETAGIYECTASNGVGKNVTVRFKVTVNCKYGERLLSLSCYMCIIQSSERNEE